MSIPDVIAERKNTRDLKQYSSYCFLECRQLMLVLKFPHVFCRKLWTTSHKLCVRFELKAISLICFGFFLIHVDKTWHAAAQFFAAAMHYHTYLWMISFSQTVTPRYGVFLGQRKLAPVDSIVTSRKYVVVYATFLPRHGRQHWMGQTRQMPWVRLFLEIMQFSWESGSVSKEM